jgi:glycosyltransferase involved in cell wall biosynthesis
VKFSIVVPVRNAVKTIGATLESCLYQDFDDYEIVVHDNASTDGTKEIVEFFDNPKIVLSGNSSPLYITDNWNLALEQASGEFIIFLGADDAIRKSTLSKLAKVLENQNIDSIGWSQAIYTWPSFGISGQANRISIPPISTGVQFIDVDAHYEELLAGKLPTLPSIYYGCISRQLIERCKQDGRFFNSRTPDLYSSILMSYFTKSYIRLEDCLTITGLSATSSVTAQLSQASGLENIRDDLSTLLENSSISRSINVPQIDLVSAWVMDCIVLIQSQLDVQGNRFDISPQHIAKLMKEEILTSGGLNLEHQNELRNWFDANALPLDFDLGLEASSQSRLLKFFPSTDIDIKIGQFYWLDATKHDIQDSFDASRFIDTVESVYALLDIDHNELVTRTNAYEALLLELKQEVLELRSRNFLQGANLLDE